MHEWIMNIGYAVYNLFSNVSGEALGDALSIMGIGMLGIFIVTGVIISAVTFLNKVFSR